jgi:polyhydroxybutyrate depolymerase
VPPRDARPRFRVIGAAAPVVLAVGLLLLAACAPSVGVPPAMAVAAATGATIDAIERSHPRHSPACFARTVHPIPERLVVRGQERLVLSHAPDGPDLQPRDLVIAFHGRTNDAARARRYFRLEGALPDAVIVYPQALRAGLGTFAWSDPGDPADALRDFELVDAIIAAVGQARCIDLGRIFVVGHSLGAYFANDVACALGDRVRAVASVAGGLQGGACIGGTAALLVHHPEDALVPIGAGERSRDAFLAANGLAQASATPAADPALTPLRCVRYGRDDAPAPVVWCVHDDATWPGGRYDPHTWPDGTPAAIAAFFRRLP